MVRGRVNYFGNQLRRLPLPSSPVQSGPLHFKILGIIEMSDQDVIEAAVTVIRAACIGDQYLISCLNGNEPETIKLRHAIWALSEAFKD